MIVDLGSSLGWFRQVYFQYHANVRLRFKLGAGLGELWTRDGERSGVFPNIVRPATLLLHSTFVQDSRVYHSSALC